MSQSPGVTPKAANISCAVLKTSESLMFLDLQCGEIEHAALANGTHVHSCCVCCFFMLLNMCLLNKFNSFRSFYLLRCITFNSSISEKTPCNMMQQPPRLQVSPQLGSQLLIFSGCSQATIYYKTQASAAPLRVTTTLVGSRLMAHNHGSGTLP